MNIRTATADDVPQMVDLSEKKRLQYQEFQPVFWRKADDSREKQIPFFQNQIKNDDIIALVHEENGEIDGFLIASVRGGRECNIDDFAIADEDKWEAVGLELLKSAGEKSKERGVDNYVVVCGHLDDPKRKMFSSFGLRMDRYWYTAPFDASDEIQVDSQVRKAAPADAELMAEVAGQPGREYPVIERDGSIVLVYEQDKRILGYTIAAVVSTPPVYNPGGQTGLVFDAVVKDVEQWEREGQALLYGVMKEAMERNAVQIVVMCDASEQQKQKTLRELGLTIASEWYVGRIK